MDGDPQFKEVPAHEAEARFARAVLTRCVWPVLKGVFYGLGVIAFLIYLGREIAKR